MKTWQCGGLTLLLAAMSAAQEYPCWRGADGSGAGPDGGTALVTDITKAKWAWESEEKRMSSCYGYLQGGIGGLAVADGKVYHAYGYPGGDVDKDMAAKFLAFYKRSESSGGRLAGALKNTLGTTGYTIEEYSDVLSKAKMADHIICMDAATGKTIWKQVFLTERPNIYGRPAGRNGPQPEGVGSWGPTFKPKSGPHNVPAVAYGKLAVIGYGGTLYCLDAGTGNEAWRKEVIPHGERDRAFGSGALCGASVLYGAGNFVCLRTKDNVLVAFDAATGEEKWSLKRGYTPTGSQGPIRFTHAGKDLMLFGPLCLDMATGKTLWSAEGAVVGGGSSSVGEGCVVFSGEGKSAGLQCYKLDADPAKAPKKVWALEAKYAGAHDCTPVITKGHVYTKMQSDIAGGDIMYAAVDLATGQKLYKAASHTDSHASMVAGDGMIFYEGHQFTAAPDFKLLPGVGEFMHCGDGASHYANSHTPPYVAGRLYIKGNNSIRCLDLRERK